jgi:hypothetical protein
MPTGPSILLFCSVEPLMKLYQYIRDAIFLAQRGPSPAQSPCKRESNYQRRLRSCNAKPREDYQPSKRSCIYIYAWIWANVIQTKGKPEILCRSAYCTSRQSSNTVSAIASAPMITPSTSQHEFEH